MAIPGPQSHLLCNQRHHHLLEDGDPQAVYWKAARTVAFCACWHRKQAHQDSAYDHAYSGEGGQDYSHRSREQTIDTGSMWEANCFQGPWWPVWIWLEESGWKQTSLTELGHDNAELKMMAVNCNKDARQLPTAHSTAWQSSGLAAWIRRSCNCWTRKMWSTSPIWQW